MTFWQTIKRIDKGDFFVKAFPSYKVNKWILNTSLALVLVWLFVAAYLEDFDFSTKNTLKCPSGGGPCYNPLHNSPSCKFGEVCTREYIMPGESYGEDPNFFLSHAWDAGFIIMFLGVSLNHVLYNRDFKIEVE